MTQKKVNPEKIRAVEAKLDQAFADEFVTPSAWVSDESLEPLNQSITAFKDTAENIGKAIDNFNGYLNTVATAFEQADQKIASQIESVEVVPNIKEKYYRQKTEEIIRSQNDYYNRI